MNTIDPEKTPSRTTYSAPTQLSLDSLERNRGRRRLIIGIVAACVAIIVVIFAVQGFSASVSAEQSEAETGEGATATAMDENAQDKQRTIEAPIDEAALKSIIGDDLTAQLVAAAENDDAAYWIASHPEAFAGDGDRVQYKLLRLAAIEPAAVPFVRAFPDKYSQEAGEACDPPAEGEIPRLYQWDDRWGYTVYCSTTFALTGCCPTVMAMVYQGLTGNGDLTPYDMGVRAREAGFMTQYSGTDSSFFPYEAAQLGLNCSNVGNTVANLNAALANGQIAVLNMGPGDFTEGGHYILAVGLDDDGQVKVNDPFSIKNSEKTWSAETLINQSLGMYVFSS